MGVGTYLRSLGLEETWRTWSTKRPKRGPTGGVGNRASAQDGCPGLWRWGSVQDRRRGRGGTEQAGLCSRPSSTLHFPLGCLMWLPPLRPSRASRLEGSWGTSRDPLGALGSKEALGWLSLPPSLALSLPRPTLFQPAQDLTSYCPHQALQVPLTVGMSTNPSPCPHL